MKCCSVFTMGKKLPFSSSPAKNFSTLIRSETLELFNPNFFRLHVLRIYKISSKNWVQIQQNNIQRSSSIITHNKLSTKHSLSVLPISGTVCRMHAHADRLYSLKNTFKTDHHHCTSLNCPPRTSKYAKLWHNINLDFVLYCITFTVYLQQLLACNVSDIITMEGCYSKVYYSDFIFFS